MKFEILVNDVDNSISDYQTAITFAGTQLLEKGYITAEYIDACLEREKLSDRTNDGKRSGYRHSPCRLHAGKCKQYQVMTPTY